ncbi:MAG: YdeI/OmpD-associated family protein [Melioribacteraceae bacterium]|nr:YdeI/OmpD-associated family protein [Melioribacteraceae bacterium]
MSNKDPRIDKFIANANDFAKPILEHFRELVHKTHPEISETLKWGMPAFEYKGTICMMAAFKNHCAIIFPKAELMKDKSLIENAKSEEAMGHLRKITSLKDLPSDKKLKSYIKESIRLNETGIKVPSKKKVEKKEIVIPDYFIKELKKNKKAFQIFNDFSFSHQKEYIDWITDAKKEETRNKRIKTAIEWISEGKSRNWKYEKC